MTRRGYRNVMLLLLLVQLSFAGYIFHHAQNLESEIVVQQAELTRLEQERANAARLSASTAELDQLTVNETNLTFVDILRYLNLADSSLSIDVSSVEDQSIGGGLLKVRTLTINGTMPYPATLNFLDSLYNGRKLIISDFVLKKAQAAPDGADHQVTAGQVEFTLTGVMYGLAKTQSTETQP